MAEAEFVKRFKAPWSVLLSLITAFTVVLFIGWPFVLFVDGGRQVLFAALLIWGITIGFLVWVFRTQFIRNYVLSGDRLIVERFGPDTDFALESLESVRKDPAAMKGIYTITNGGLFAFSGKKCRNRKLGVFEAYATDKKRSVVLRFPNRILVVTPEAPEAFVMAVNGRITFHRRGNDI